MDNYFSTKHNKWIVTSFASPVDITGKLYKLAKKNKSKILQYCKVTYNTDLQEIIEFIFPQAFIGVYLNECKQLLGEGV
jgi:hypothetical protein